MGFTEKNANFIISTFVFFILVTVSLFFTCHIVYLDKEK